MFSGAYQSQVSYAGLTRVSILLREEMDRRVSPAITVERTLRPIPHSLTPINHPAKLALPRPFAGHIWGSEKGN